MIRLVDVHKSYLTPRGRKHVLRGATFEVPHGVSVALLGRNGAGKSTLVRLLGGTEQPDRGRIEVGGRISWPLGLTGGLQGSLTGRDNARFVCRIYCRSEAEMAEKLAFVEDFADLGNYFDMPVKTYSSGMRGRIGFALSMAFDFDIYLVDEIMAVGDQVFRGKATKAFDAMRGRSALVMVSHNMDTLRRHCNAGVVLKDGEAVFHPDINDAIRYYQEAA